MLTTEGASTGVAMIMVDDGAQNCIAVIPGANASVGLPMPGRCARAGEAGLLLLQLEVPMPAVQRAAAIAREAGCQVLLNPAPAQALPEALWPSIDILVLNETEAGMLAGLEPVDPAECRRSRGAAASGPAHVIVTLGAHGVVWPRPQVRA